MKELNVRFMMKAAGLVLLSLVTSCASFKGEIPLSGISNDISYISPMNQDGIQDSFVLPIAIPDTKGLKIAGYNISVISETGEKVFTMADGQVIPEGKKIIAGKKRTVKIPEEIIWEGINNEGSWVNDGLYMMDISAWDFSGNRGALDPVAIIVDNTAPSAEVNLPYLVFSPNGDGNQDILDLYQTSSSEDEWTGEFIDQNNGIALTQKWPGLAQNFHWDGKNNGGEQLNDNEYLYRLSSTDKAGNSFSLEIDGIIIETKSFDISIVSEGEAFSPNSDEIQDSVSFLLEADRADQINQLNVVIIDEKGDIRREISPLSKTFPQKIIFDGKDNKGKVLREGNYYALFSATYRNGNNPRVTSSPVTLDLTPPQAVISRNYQVFSPDGDGKKDELTINQTTSIEGIWEGIISDESGKTVNSYQWQERALTFKWDGRDEAGNIVPDGTYGYTLKTTDSAGITGSYRSLKFAVDTQPTPVTVRNRTVAFSPNGDGIDDFMEFELNPAVKEGIIDWNYIITDTRGNEVFHFGLDNKNQIPSDLSWNGTNLVGDKVEGEFLGVLNVEYEKGNQALATTETPFVLDMSPPVIEHSLSPLPFSPDGDGVNDILKINITVKDDRGVKNWSASILDPTGQVFYNIPTDQFRNGVFNWNGLSPRKELVGSALDYTLVIKAEDSVGNTVTVSDTIPIDILVLKDGNNLKISISSINFKPYTADYMDLPPELKQKNMATLDRLAVILKKYSAYKIQLEGHGVRVYWNNPAKWLKEENETLLALSSLRAESIRDALILRGIDGARMTTTGRGGYFPLVPHSDEINRWKNRRVEFILIK